jgi:AAA domain
LRQRDTALANAVSSVGSPTPSAEQIENTLAEVKKRKDSATKASQEAKDALDKALRNQAAASTTLEAIRAEVDRHLAELEGLRVTLAQRKAWDLRSVDEKSKQLSTPWYDEALWSLRHEAFIAALDLHKAFLKANDVQVTDNLKFLSKVLTGAETARGISVPIRDLWDTLFLAVPVVSTTFASMPRLFSSLTAEELGWLIIDEAGQATPQQALGSIWRFRRSVIVGDPLQIEPVVPVPEATIEMIREKFKVGHQWHPIANSAQVLADRANKWGTSLTEGATGLWLGCPLRVHRRCADPMFRIANQIAYDNMMVYGTPHEEGGDDGLGESAWFDIGSEGAEGHWIPAQGAQAARIVRAVIARKGSAFTNDGKSNIYVVSPFKAAAEGIRDLLKEGQQNDAAVDAAKHADRIAGTVHTFQGKQADTVVLLLCGDPDKPGARSGFAARAPNLLNVALTRAKRRIYVIGDRRRWSDEKYFNVLAANLKLTTPKRTPYLTSLPRSIPASARMGSILR